MRNAGRSSLRKILQSVVPRADGLFQAIETKAYRCLGMDIAAHLTKHGRNQQPVTPETIMNSSANHPPIPTWRINRSVLLGVCLIALTAVLFYGPVLLLLWRELR
jgi:hypothetical protein